MIQRLAIILVCTTIGFIGLVKLVPIIVDKEIHRQDVACQTLEDRGYPVKCH